MDAEKAGKSGSDPGKQEEIRNGHIRRKKRYIPI